MMKAVHRRDSLLSIDCPALAATMLGLVACASETADPNSTEGHVAIAAQRIDVDTPIYLNPDYSPEERAADLVTRMTLDEKVSQLISSMAPAIPRPGVAKYGW